MISKTPCPIVFLINSLCEGGAERAMLTIAKQFINDGHTVTILALTKNNFYDIPMGVNIIYLSTMDDRKSGLLKMLYMPYHAWKVKQYVKKYKVKTVQSYLFRANFVNILSTLFFSKQNVQVVNRSVVSRFFSEGLSGKINLFLISKLYPKADKIIHISKQMKVDFNKHFFSSLKEKVIYNPYDIKSIALQIEEPIDNFYFSKEKHYLITVGRLISLKRFQDVLYALKELGSNVELILLGDGEERKKLEEIVVNLSLGTRVHFLGQVKNPFKYIAKSDVFISSSEIEGFPNVLLESMLCKTLVISSDCLSGPREILAPKTKISKQLLSGIEEAEYGFLYAVGDVKKLREIVDNILRNKSLRENYTEKAFAYAQNFSVKKISQKYKEVICYE